MSFTHAKTISSSPTTHNKWIPPLKLHKILRRLYNKSYQYSHSRHVRNLIWHFFGSSHYSSFDQMVSCKDSLNHGSSTLYSSQRYWCKYGRSTGIQLFYSKSKLETFYSLCMFNQLSSPSCNRILLVFLRLKKTRVWTCMMQHIYRTVFAQRSGEICRTTSCIFDNNPEFKGVARKRDDCS